VSREGEGEWATFSNVHLPDEYLQLQAKNYDVALLNMTKEFPFRKGFVMPKEIFHTEEVLPAGTVCAMPGYGSTNTKEDKTRASRLYFLPMPIIKNRYCSYYHHEEICTALLGLSAGGCPGDSGVRMNAMNRLLQLGGLLLHFFLSLR
jgi:Trypsin